MLVAKGRTILSVVLKENDTLSGHDCKVSTKKMKNPPAKVDALAASSSVLAGISASLATTPVMATAPKEGGTKDTMLGNNLISTIMRGAVTPCSHSTHTKWCLRTKTPWKCASCAFVIKMANLLIMNPNMTGWWGMSDHGRIQ